MSDAISNADTAGEGIEKQKPDARILVVDDDAMVLKTLEIMLSSSGYPVATANSVANAKVKMLENDHFDLVITDMKMPDESGIALLTFSMENFPDTSRILMTGFADLEHTIRAINEGGSDFIVTKPWNRKHLLQIVESQIEKAHLRRHNKELLRLIDQKNLELTNQNANLERLVKERTIKLRQLAASLTNSNRSLLKSYRSTIKVLLKVAGLHKSVNKELSQIASELGSSLARTLELDKASVSAIRYACQLHELGKLSLPDSVASMPEMHLSEAELREYIKYPEAGVSTLTDVEYLAQVGLLIRHHREHWDGSGFPAKLKGEEIPLGSQVVLISREYAQSLLFYEKRKRTIGKSVSDMDTAALAYEAIEQWRSIKFKPELVDALKKTIAVQDVVDEQGEAGASGRLISAKMLEPGMLLTKDVYTSKDVLMLTKGQVLTERQIARLLDVERESGNAINIFVQG